MTKFIGFPYDEVIIVKHQIEFIEINEEKSKYIIHLQYGRKVEVNSLNINFYDLVAELNK